MITRFIALGACAGSFGHESHNAQAFGLKLLADSRGMKSARDQDSQRFLGFGQLRESSLSQSRVALGGNKCNVPLFNRVPLKLSRP